MSSIKSPIIIFSWVFYALAIITGWQEFQQLTFSWRIIKATQITLPEVDSQWHVDFVSKISPFRLASNSSVIQYLSVCPPVFLAVFLYMCVPNTCEAGSRKSVIAFCTCKKITLKSMGTLLQMTAIVVNSALIRWKNASCYAFCIRLAICQ